VKRSSKDRIMTTHVGSLPDVSVAHNDQGSLTIAIAGAVRQQKELGIDVINEGEHTKGADWLRYIETRLTGFEPEAEGPTIIHQGRDREEFADYYKEQEAMADASTRIRRPRGRRNWVCTAPIHYTGEGVMRRAIEACKANLAGDEEFFLTTTAPASFEPYRRNAYYKTQEEFLFALGAAMSTEYHLIADAGFLVKSMTLGLRPSGIASASAWGSIDSGVTANSELRCLITPLEGLHKIASAITFAGAVGTAAQIRLTT
jgi:5-methyltetrahydropteroyltriglutamate--homocysteine methyltransferase